MAILKKANRVINVGEEHVAGYLQRGYDLIDHKGKIIKHATGGKMVPLAEYNKVVAKLEELESTSSEDLQPVVAELKAKVEEQQGEIKVLEQENERLDKLVRQFKGNQNRK